MPSRKFVGFILRCSPVLFLIVGCADNGWVVLEPQGPNARQISHLWWLLFGLGTFTYVLVMGLFIFALFRRQAESSIQNNAQRGQRMIWTGGIIFPTIVLFIIFGASFKVLSNLSLEETNDPMVIEIVGRQWWWEVRYPDQDIVTANEIYIPTGQQVRLALTSADVIHSFWVPELHGKMDLIPGKVNIWPLEADQPGDYWGACAEYCGTQHAKMLLLVTAVSPTDFQDWLESQQAPFVEPETAELGEGFDLFMDTGCGQCHTIRGTSANGSLGPDLTHLASRRTIGAGSVANNRGNLSGWVADPHGIKPGSLMPTATLTGEGLQSLILFLESLE
jgi:cytochrome c oxidase subunit 2